MKWIPYCKPVGRVIQLGTVKYNYLNILPFGFLTLIVFIVIFGAK